MCHQITQVLAEPIYNLPHIHGISEAKSSILKSSLPFKKRSKDLFSIMFRKS